MAGNKDIWAWAMLVSALALHVLDEALNDFLGFYNPLVRGLKERFGFWPMPEFSFGVWIGGLAAVVLLGFLVIPLVRRRSKPVRRFTNTLGVLMILNGLGHMVGSIYLGRILPGFWSSPLLIAASVWVVVRGFSQSAGPVPISRR